MVRRNKKHVCHIACPGKCSSHVRVSAPCSQHLAQKWSIPGIHFCKFQILPTNWAPPIHPELSTSGGKERGHSPSENHVKSKLAGPKAAPLGGKPVSQSVSQSGLAASGAKLYTNFFFWVQGPNQENLKFADHHPFWKLEKTPRSSRPMIIRSSVHNPIRADERIWPTSSCTSGAAGIEMASSGDCPVTPFSSAGFCEKKITRKKKGLSTIKLSSNYCTRC